VEANSRNLKIKTLESKKSIKTSVVNLGEIGFHKT
jgi:predicted metal-dependent TIM-barrel fold hydrolase